MFCINQSINQLSNQLINQSVLIVLYNINNYICTSTYLLHISLLFLICIIYNT